MTKDASEIIKIARSQDRFSTQNLIDYIFTDFIELHGDRNFADDLAIVGGIAMLDNQPVTVIGIQKGINLQDNLKRNFGQPHPEGYRKALRLMQQAEKFNRPVITFINTAGAFSGIGAEERGQGEAIAKNLMAMSDLSVPIISVIIGEGGSGGALALGVGNEVWMFEHAMYAILSPEGFASILWKDGSRAKEAAQLMKITANELLDMKVIDKVIPETFNGKKIPVEKSFNMLKKNLIDKINLLSDLSVDELKMQRYNRFRKF